MLNNLFSPPRYLFLCIYANSTLAYIPFMYADYFNYTTNNVPSSLSFGIVPYSTCNSVTLGNNVTANILGGTVCELSVGDQVTLNVNVIRNWRWNDFEISTLQQLSAVNPIKFNINSTVTLTNAHIFAEVDITTFGSLTIAGDVKINGSGIRSASDLTFSNAVGRLVNLTVSSLYVPAVSFKCPSVLTVYSPLNTSFKGGGYFETILLQVNTAGTTYINPGITLSSPAIQFNSSYVQEGGYINFEDAHFQSSIPLITVNGTITLSSVTFYGYLPTGINKLVIMKTMTNSINEKSISFSNSYPPYDGTAVHLHNKNGEIYLERKIYSAVENFFRDNDVVIIFTAIMVFIVVALSVFGVVRNRCKKQQYSQIN